MPSAQLCLQIMFIQAKLHLFQLAGHFTSFSVWWLTTSNVWVWACACASCCVLVMVSGFLHPRKKKKNLSQKRQNVSNMESEATSGLFLSLFLLRTWQLSTLKDRRANNYLSQVAGVIVGGWKMSDEDRVCVSPKMVCPFDPAVLQTHWETVFVSPDKRSAAFTWAGSANYTLQPTLAETKRTRAGWATETRLGSPFIKREWGGGYVLKLGECKIFSFKH